MGLTDINIVPHYNSNKNLKLGEKDFYQDVIYPDTFKFNIYVLSDGSYIYIDEKEKNIYGECYTFCKGNFKKVCFGGSKLIIY